MANAEKCEKKSEDQENKETGTTKEKTVVTTLPKATVDTEKRAVRCEARLKPSV
jgi:hypothetical protein